MLPPVNPKKMKNTEETAGALPTIETQSPRPKTPKPRFDPAKLPLVQMFRLAAKLSRRHEICVSEAWAIHRAASQLGCMADFCVSGIKRDASETDFDELYAAYLSRCAFRGDSPRSQAQFEQLLLLDPVKVNLDESKPVSGGKSNVVS